MKIKYFIRRIFLCVFLFVLVFSSVSCFAQDKVSSSRLEKSNVKVSNAWVTLNKKQKKIWQDWAKNNCLYLFSGKSCHVSAKKAFDFVIQNRMIMGEPLNIEVVPSSPSWLPNVLSTRDAGPYTENHGYMGFRADQELKNPSKWFVWATPPVSENVKKPLKNIHFIKAISLGAMEFDDVVPTFGQEYITVNGSFDGPNVDGSWPTSKYVWFRLQEYQDGQLGPIQIMKGHIEVEL